jgi:hypothetical protein
MSIKAFMLLAIATLGGLVGCAAAPTVEFSRITSSSQLKGDEFDSYAFQRSMVSIEARKDDKNVPIAPLDLKVKSGPIESTDFKIALRRADKPGVKTNLNISKIDNTDLVKEIGVEVVDSRVDLITKIGGILVKLAPIAFSATEGLSVDELPLNVNMQVVMVDKRVLADAVNEIEVRPGIIADFGAIPVDARPIDQLPVGQPVSAFFYAACRSVLIKVQLKGQRFEQRIKISDPRYFQSVGLPVKGKVSMHSECGASVASEKDTGVKSTPDLIDALVVQGKAIKDAIDAAKKN